MHDHLNNVFKRKWLKLKDSIAKQTQNKTNQAETTQPGWRSRNNAHMRPILSSND